MGRVTKSEVAARLEILRALAGLTQEEIAPSADFKGKSGWNNATNPDQKAILNVEKACGLCDDYGVTLDWIYRNSLAGMPSETKDKIIEIRKRLASGESLDDIRNSNRVERLRNKTPARMGKARR